MLAPSPPRRHGSADLGFDRELRRELEAWRPMLPAVSLRAHSGPRELNRRRSATSSGPALPRERASISEPGLRDPPPQRLASRARMRALPARARSSHHTLQRRRTLPRATRLARERSVSPSGDPRPRGAASSRRRSPGRGQRQRVTRSARQLRGDARRSRPAAPSLSALTITRTAQ